MEEGALLLGGAEEALVDALGRQRRRQRHVAAGEALGEAEQVRRDALLLAGEHRPGAAEAGRDLVADQQHAVAVAELAHRAQVARRVDDHPGGALHQRLDDHRGDLLLVHGEDARQVGRVAGLGACGLRRAAGGRWRGRGRCRRPRPSRSCRRGRRRGGGRRRCAGCAGRRAAAGTGRPSSARSRSRSSPSRSRRRARGPGGAISTRRAASSAAPRWERPSIVEWATLPSWSLDRRVDPGVAMAVDVAPERGDAVEVAAALGVDQVGALGPLDHQRLFLAPGLLLGERVPEVVAIELCVIRPTSQHRHVDRAPGRKPACGRGQALV